MKNYCQLIALLFISSVFLTSCGSDNKEEEKDNNTISINLNGKDGESINIDIDGKEDIEKAMQGLKESLKNLGDEIGNIDINIEDDNGEKIEALAASELKKMLPSRIAGLEKKDYSSEKSGMFGFKVSEANARYSEDDESVKVKIVDIGGVGKMAAKFANLADLEVDKEDSNGNYERMIEIEDQKGIEKYRANQDKYELTFFVNARFVVEMTGRNVKSSKLKNAMEDIIEELEDY